MTIAHNTEKMTESIDGEIEVPQFGGRTVCIRMKGQGGSSTQFHRLHIDENSSRGGYDSVALVLMHPVSKVDPLEVWTAAPQVEVDDQQPEIRLEFQGYQERNVDLYCSMRIDSIVVVDSGTPGWSRSRCRI